MSSRYGNLDYPTLTKGGILVGVLLFVLGEVGEYAASVGWVQLPGWQSTVPLDAAIVGVLAVLLSPFVFGILLPLTE